MRSHRFGRLVVIVLLHTLWPALALAQQPKAGTVTSVRGEATLARPVLPRPVAVKFKDDVFVRDEIDTQEESVVRLLLGGKALVTVRELSTFTVTEEPGRAVVNLEKGKLALAVAKRLLRPGESVEIRTPNAIAAVRGSYLVVDVRVVAGTTDTTLTARKLTAPITVCARAGLTGGCRPGTTIPLTGNQVVSFSGVGAATAMGPIRTVTPQEAEEADETGEAPKQTDHTETPPDQAAQTATTDQVEQASELAALLAPEKEGEATGLVAETPPSSTPSTPPSSTSDICVVCTEITEAATAPQSQEFIKNGGFETGDFTNWTLAGAGSVESSLGPFSAPEGTLMALIHTGSGAVSNTTSTLTQEFSVGSVLLINFTYNFMTNEFPDQDEIFDDFLEATLTDAAGNTTQLAFESRNSSTFTLTPATVSAGGFTLAGPSSLGPPVVFDSGFTDFKSVSKTVVAASGPATLTFQVMDVGDTVVDSGALIDAVAVTQDPPLYLVRDGQTLIGPSDAPLVEVSNGALTEDSILLICCPGPEGPSSASLGGPVLKASHSTLTVPFSLLGLLEGSTLTTTSSDPLVWLDEGTHSLSTVPGAAIFDFWGITTGLDEETPLTLGTDMTLQHSGGFLTSSGATVNTQKVLKIDTALLEASAPLLNLTAGSSATSASNVLDLVQRAKVTADLPSDAFIKLDASTLTVTSGAAVNVAGGSFLKVTGDLIQLSNASTLNILNGSALDVSGGSVVTISGALVAFAGTSGNAVNITNSLCPCEFFGGLPVALTGGALSSNVSITNPIKNSSLGTINLSNQNLGSSGTAVVAVDGAASKVTISGK